MVKSLVHRIAGTSLVTLVALCAGVASAAPTAIGIGAFGPGSTTFSFGAAGAPSLPGMTFTNFDQDDPATWMPGAEPPYNSAGTTQGAIAFATPVNQVGFFFGGNTANRVTLEIIVGGLSAGTFLLETTGTDFAMGADGVTNWKFYGFEDTAGISELRFGKEQNNAWYYGIGELKVSSPTASVPEPGSLMLLAAALLGIIGVSHRSAASARRAESRLANNLS